jgi:IMP dehydrogenase
VKLPHDLFRAVQLVEAGADLLVVDIAHGHSAIAVDMLRALKSNPVTATVDVVCGNVATGEGALALIEAGADGIKAGVGPGSICITRIVAGSGVPQLSALFEVCAVARKHGVPVIADGGVRAGGDVVKAIAAGADTVMLGSALAGTDETPGRVLTRNGQKVKLIRGMAGESTNVEKARREGKSEEDVYNNLVAEGVEGYVGARGPVAGVLFALAGGLRSGMSYSNSRTLEELKQRAIFVRMTGNGLKESGSHDISKL